MTTNDTARAFDLLGANPKAHFTLILRTLGRLMLMDAAATVDLAVALYPMLKVRHVSVCVGGRASLWRAGLGACCVGGHDTTGRAGRRRDSVHSAHGV